MRMFPLPENLETEVFARIPDSYRVHDGTSRWVDIQRQGTPMDCFIEGPSFDRDGNLYVVDIPWANLPHHAEGSRRLVL